MKIEIDPAAGFCFGVDSVIREAEARLRAGESLFGLGEMVHNQAEVERLRKLGLKTIRHSDLSSMAARKVLFRAHGEPPSTYRIAREYGVEVIDGTCPIVTRLQKRIREVYMGMDPEREQLVIFGKPDHPETIGLVGQVDGNALVVSGEADIRKIEPGKKVHLFSQTTMDPDRFSELERAIKNRLGTGTETNKESFSSECTICGQMKRRKPSLAAFAQQFDLVLFVSGKNSSNGKMLFEFCLGINSSTKWIAGPGDVDPAWLEGIGRVGISGATSTSREQLEAVREQVTRIAAP
jgi:4-hydroxy-3-methylbut-2-en-1-yl diphosphate reductase